MVTSMVNALGDIVERETRIAEQGLVSAGDVLEGLDFQYFLAYKTSHTRNISRKKWQWFTPNGPYFVHGIDEVRKFIAERYAGCELVNITRYQGINVLTFHYSPIPYSALV